MQKIIIFQGLLNSKGRNFNLKTISNNVIYSSTKDILEFINKLKIKNYKIFLFLWKQEINKLKDDIEFEALSKENNIIEIPEKSFPRGKLKSNFYQKNKLLHYYAMTHGIERLLINNLISSNDLIFRCRTDINFDIDVFDNEVTENILNLEKNKILNQYWMENNSRWFIDFVFGGKVEIIYSLYSNLYLRCSNNIDNAYSVHQDLMKSIASIYIPKFLIFSEGPPKPLTRKEVQILFSQEPSQKVKVQSKYIFFMTCIMRLFIISSLFISRVIFWIYTKYEEAIFYTIYHYCTFQMSFKFQSSINWRGEKCTPNYSEFIKDHKNSLCVFSQEIDNEK